MWSAPPEGPPISAAELWENLEAFLTELVPVAEGAGVTLAMHPDDPDRHGRRDACLPGGRLGRDERHDHVPQLVGEDDGVHSYTMLGRLYAYGYIQGLIQATASG